MAAQTKGGTTAIDPSIPANKGTLGDSQGGGGGGAAGLVQPSASAAAVGKTSEPPRTVLASTVPGAAADTKLVVGPTAARGSHESKAVTTAQQAVALSVAVGKRAPVPAETIRKALPQPLPPPPPLFSVRGAPPEVIELLAFSMPEPSALEVVRERSAFVSTYVPLLALRGETSSGTIATGPLLGSGPAGPAELIAKAPYGTGTVWVAISVGLQLPLFVQAAPEGLEVVGVRPTSSTLGSEIAVRLRAIELARRQARATAKQAITDDRTARRLWTDAHKVRDDISRLESEGRIERAATFRERVRRLNDEALRHNTESLRRVAQNQVWTEVVRRQAAAADQLARRAFDLGTEEQAAAELRASLDREALRGADREADVTGEPYRLAVTAATHGHLGNVNGD